MAPAMQTPGTATSSAITASELAKSVADFFERHWSEIHLSREDIVRLKAKLETIAKTINKFNDTTLTKISSDAISRCYDDIKRLEAKLEQRTQSVTRRYGLPIMIWPFSKKDVETQLQRLDSYLDVFELDLLPDAVRGSSLAGIIPVDSEDETILDRLPRAHQAGFDSAENVKLRRCLHGTRQTELTRLNVWASDKTIQPILCLKGMAGTGKSTIALTFAESCARTRLVASFFFKRGRDDRNSCKKLFPTIAWQLARKSKSFRNLIAETIQENPELLDSPLLHRQYIRLFFEPLRLFFSRNHPQTPIVLIIDALDECEDGLEIRLLLDLFSKAVHPGLRILFTCRLDANVKMGLGEIPSTWFEVLNLQSVPSRIADEEMALYFSHELSRIAMKHGLDPQWPGASKLQTLVRQAGGLYIFAATACRYIDAPHAALARQRLHDICAPSKSSRSFLREMDEMYQAILEKAFCPEGPNADQRPTPSHFRRVVGSLAVSFDSLSAIAFDELLFPSSSSSANLVMDTLKNLSPVIDTSAGPSSPIRILHVSFNDYILDGSRCLPRFWVDEAEVHHSMFASCMTLLSKSLRENICELDSPGTFVDDIEDSRVEALIPDAVKYASVHWINHLESSSRGLESRSALQRSTLKQFFQRNFLRWLEAMSLLRKCGQAAEILLRCEASLNENQTTDLGCIINDCLRFSLLYSGVISRAPLQVYLIASNFSPRASVVRLMTRVQCSRKESEVHAEIPLDWNPCLFTLDSHASHSNGFLFSKSGKTIFSGSSDGKIRLWNAKTGTCEDVLESDVGDVRIIDVKRNMLLAVRGDRQLQLWNTHTNECVYDVDDSMGPSAARLFKDMIVTASRVSPSIILLDSETGACRYILEGHRRRITHIEVLEDAILTAASDRTVKLWDTEDWRCRYTFDDNPTPAICIALSDNVAVAGFKSGRIRLWSTKSGDLLRNLYAHAEEVCAIALNSRYLASGSPDCTVKVWDVNTGSCHSTFWNPDITVSCIAISPVEDLVATGSPGAKVIVWDIASGECRSVLEGHTGPILDVAFSPDGKVVASGSKDGTVRVWDASYQRQNELLISESPIVSHKYVATNDVYKFAFSEAGDLAIALGNAGMINVWRFQRGTPVLNYTSMGPKKWPHLAISPCGHFFTVTSWHMGAVWIWEARDQIMQIKAFALPTADLKKNDSGIWHGNSILQFSTDGRWLVCCSHAYGPAIRVWEVHGSHDQSPIKIRAGDRQISCLAISDSGSFLAYATDEVVHVHSLTDGIQSVMHSIETGPRMATSLLFGQDETNLVAGFDSGACQIWHVVPSGVTRLQQLGCSGVGLELFEGIAISSITLSADDGMIAFRSENGRVQIWDLVVKQQILEIEDIHMSSQFRFSPDSSRLLIDGAQFDLAVARKQSHTQDAPVLLVPLSQNSLQLEPSSSATDTLAGKNGAGEWVTSPLGRLLWIPHEFRSTRVWRRGGVMAVGVKDKVMFITHPRVGSGNGGIHMNTVADAKSAIGKKASSLESVSVEAGCMSAVGNES